jgi:Sulfatase-modifying factor enzyme 1
LITLSTERKGESDLQYVDIIHETLIRPRSRDEKTGKRIGYWPTLYDYIEQNRDRDIHRQQLRLQTERWLASKRVGRWWNLAGWRPLPEMVRVPEGRFVMGCLEGRDDVGDGCHDDEKPAEVTITHPFLMGKHEVTFLEYDYSVWDRKRRGDTRVSYPNDSGWGRYDRPVINIRWEDAKAYVQWLRETTGGSYRLPSSLSDLRSSERRQVLARRLFAPY